MIIRDSESHFTMTTQHDHAILSGEIAKFFEPSYFGDTTFIDGLLLAIRENDRGWIGLDETPIWNDNINAPFSFMNYPIYPKLPMYAKGISEVEKMNDYAGLLCSIHYTSFGHIRKSKHPDCIEYMNNEINRQQRINKKLNYPDSDIVTNHYRLLQLCDELSLYVCLNKEGASKNEEHPWYKDGFETMIGTQKFIAEWISETEIRITPFPFNHSFKTVLLTKHVQKELRNRVGIKRAYKETDFSRQEITFLG